MVTSVIDAEISSLREECALLTPLAQQLRSASTPAEKVSFLDAFSRVQEGQGAFQHFLNAASLEEQLIIKAVIAAGQAKRVFSGIEGEPKEKLQALLRDLSQVETFYREIGGLVGYHLLMLQCLVGEEEPPTDEVVYHPPQGIDIRVDSLEVRRDIICAIEQLEEMAEIYPVGGAADRLNLQDEKGVPLPAAKLNFGGKTLLERLIADLQAREHLHYKLFGRQLCTPLVMMTSQEKDNHAQILAICEERGWFGRPKSSFRFFSQASVPSMNRRGEWCMQGTLQLLLKPGGHGVIWKLARDSQTFDWLFSLGKEKALVRQINNPIAGTDYGLLAFTGFGLRENKVFGFASCPRKKGAAEGVNVLRERKVAGLVEYALTNVEYCDLQKFRVVQRQHAQFSSNTNILFIDLQAVNRAVASNPFPGVLINPKKTVYRRGDELVEEEIARLESTMQNIADCFAEILTGSMSLSKLGTFLTFNERRKTISSVKREYFVGSSFDETPEGCFGDFMENAKELLLQACGMELVYKKIDSAFPFIFTYHPSLGPLYSIIAQKIRGGKIAKGSELNLEISEIDMCDLDLDGSLTVAADEIMGHTEQGLLAYSEKRGRCVLKNVRVRNAGINWQGDHGFWKGSIERCEECRITICGDGEFYAEDVTFDGPVAIKVAAGERVSVKSDGNISREKIDKPGWAWKYSLSDDFKILISKE